MEGRGRNHYTGEHVQPGTELHCSLQAERQQMISTSTGPCLPYLHVCEGV